MKRWFYVTLGLIIGALLFSTHAGADWQGKYPSCAVMVVEECADGASNDQVYQNCLLAGDALCDWLYDDRPVPSVDELSVAHALFIETIYSLNRDQADPDQRHRDDQADPVRQGRGTSHDGNR